MSILTVRIDDRLIHGQVIEGWLKSSNANNITIISDDVAGDNIQQTLMSMAIPDSVKFDSFSVEEAAQKIKDGYFNDLKAMFLLSNPQDIVRLIKLGVKFQSINVGGMHFSPGKKQILKTLSVDKDDVNALIEIINNGIELEGRVLPDDERLNIADIIKKEKL